MSRCLLIFLLCACSETLVAQDDVEVRDLVILAGQSNAVGFDAQPSELEQDPTDAKVLFWWKCGDPPPDEHDSNSSNAWTRLQPQPLGDPIKPRRDRQYGNYAQVDGGFGPEIGFARAWLSDPQSKPERGLAIIKTAFSGTGIGRDWDPDSDTESGACFRAMMKEINKATAAAKHQNLVLRPRAFLWVQGESDANATDAPLYQQRLGRMLTVLREQLDAPELQVRIAVNTKFGNGNNAFLPAIVTAQQDYAASDPNTAYVDTSAAPIANAAHYDTQGTLLVGRLFAESLITH